MGSLIVGLGNMGADYEHTRHNVGFDILEALADNFS
ncbi:aminoacyl-tRNA hydrolase, partial [Patescibacteria group bacterium]|nr:aminoacyl-tRNA hydrolase [Patescibacteria group bacterium]